VAKVNVTPDGVDPIQPTDNPTGELKPLIDVTVSVVVPLVPWTTNTVVGEAEIEKSAYPVCVIATVRVVLCDRLPLLPVIVMV